MKAGSKFGAGEKRVYNRTMYSVLILGGGNLGGAIARRLVGHAEVSVVDKHEDKLAALRAAGVTHAVESLALLPTTVDLAIVAVKPAVTTQAVETLKSQNPQVILSVAAGVTRADLQRAAPHKAVVVRAMMNTAVAHGQGCVVLSQESECPQWVSELLAPLGDVFTLPERLLDAATAVSACAPAYFLTAMEGLADGGVRLGIPRTQAEAMAVSAARGAVAVAQASSVRAAHTAIVSPGGSTAAGLAVLERQALRAAFADAAQASALAASGSRKEAHE